MCWSHKFSLPPPIPTCQKIRLPKFFPTTHLSLLLGRTTRWHCPAPWCGGPPLAQRHHLPCWQSPASLTVVSNATWLNATWLRVMLPCGWMPASLHDASHSPTPMHPMVECWRLAAGAPSSAGASSYMAKTTWERDDDMWNPHVILYSD